MKMKTNTWKRWTKKKNNWNESKNKEQITFKWRNENENEYMKKMNKEKNIWNESKKRTNNIQMKKWKWKWKWIHEKDEQRKKMIEMNQKKKNK